MILKKFRYYSLTEFFTLIKYSIGHKLISQSSKGLSKTNNLIDNLLDRGIKVKKDKKNILFKYRINTKSFSISLERSSSDSSVFRQIILNQEYVKVLEFFKRHEVPFETMIDAGANIGLTSIYFSAFFPKVNIVALEPFESTAERLNKHVHENELSNIEVVKKGLWGERAFLAEANVTAGIGQDWGFSLVEVQDESKSIYEAIPVPDVMSKFSSGEVDFLKIDIEGGEISVFDKDTDLSWLNKVKVLAIEIHDEFNCRKNIEDLLMSQGFTLSHSGELTIGVNNHILPNLSIFD